MVKTMSSTRAPREVIDRLPETLQHRADGDDVGTALHCLIGGVAGVQIREDEHGGLPGDLALGCFLPAHFQYGGGVVLQGAVDHQFGILAAGDFRGQTHFLHVFPRAGGAGAVADHRDLGLDAEGDGAIRALFGDFGQLFGGGRGVDRAVAIDQHLIRHEHEEYRGDDRGTRGPS